MYLVRRVCKTKPGKAWEVAGYLSKICQAYEKGGRAKAQVYHTTGVPGEQNVVYAQWVQERIEPTVLKTVPKSIYEDDAKMQELLTGYEIEFYTLVTPQKLKERGFS